MTAFWQKLRSARLPILSAGRRSGGRSRRLTLEPLESRSLLATFTVTTTSDDPEAQGKLRDAIFAANNNPGHDLIAFNIQGPVGSILLEDELPEITDAVTIDGYTQPGSAPNTDPYGFNGTLRIEVLGQEFIDTSLKSGLRIRADGCTIRGLVINKFPFYGIEMLSSGNTIEGNFIGVDPSGSVRVGNSYGAIAVGKAIRYFVDGTEIDPGIFVAADNTIGGDSPAARNILVGTPTGPYFVGTETILIVPGDQSTGNRVIGNFIGTDKSGTVALDYPDGIPFAVAVGAPGSVIRDNVIAGSYEGINLGTSGNVVQRNHIGTDLTGTRDLGNMIGIDSTAADNLIGGLDPADGNVIFGNDEEGILVTAPGNLILSNRIWNNGSPEGFLGQGIFVDQLADWFQKAPTLTAVETTGAATTIHGTLDSAPGTYTLQFFANDEADPSGFGEGKFLLGTASVTPDAAGQFTALLPVGVGLNQLVTATASNAANTTSQFSAAVAVNLSASGDVVVTADTPQSLLDSLTTVNGSIFLVNIDGREFLILPNLVSVLQDIIVTGNASLLGISAPQLAEVGGDFTVSTNGELVTIEAGNLSTVGGDFTVTANGELVTVDASGLSTVGGDFVVTANPNVYYVEAGNLSTVGGDLAVSGNTSAGTVEMGNLNTVGGDLVVANNSSATSIDLGGLVTGGGDLIVAGNTQAESIDLATLQGVGGDVVVEGNPSLQSVDLRSLLSVFGVLLVNGNLASTVIDLTALREVGGAVSISGNVSVTQLLLDNLFSAGSLAIVDNPSLPSLIAPALTEIVGAAQVTNNSSMVTLDLGGLTSAGDDVVVEGNGSAMSIDLGGLTSTGGDLVVAGNSSATSIDLGGLISTGGDLVVASNASATSIDLSGLTSVGGNMTVEADESVTAVTADGTTELALLTSQADMTVFLASQTFTSPVDFTVTRLEPAALPAESGENAAGAPAIIDPLFAYQFQFAIPTLNLDAQLTFEIDVAALTPEDEAALLAALAAGSATVAVKNDTPGSVYQAFALCPPGETPDGSCVSLTLLDAEGNVLPAGSSAPAFVRFEGVTGHFSIFAVVIVTPQTAQVEGIVINDGGPQRSMINSVTIIFDRLVTIDAGAFELYRQGLRKPIPVQINVSESDGQTVAILTFKGHGTIGNSLSDGQYRLVVRADRVHDDGGRQLDGDGDGQAGGDYVDEFFRRFGDTDGDGDVDRIDKDVFFAAYGKRSHQPGYLWYLDYNANGRVWKEDLAQLLLSCGGKRGRR